MRRIAIIMALAMATICSATSAAQDAPVADQAKQDAVIDQAVTFIHARKPAEALAVLDPLIAEQEKQLQAEKRMAFCPRSPSETLLYLGMAANENKDAVAFGHACSLSLYLKGFVLIDLGRGDEAKAYLDRAIALAPNNAQYLGELGEWHKSRKQWPAAYAAFESAAASAELSPDNAKDFEKARAWRGMGYVLIEQGKLAEAKALFEKCLALNPNDKGARSELDYIHDLEAKAKAI